MQDARPVVADTWTVVEHGPPLLPLTDEAKVTEPLLGVALVEVTAAVTTG